MKAGNTSVFSNRRLTCAPECAPRPAMVEFLEERTFLSAAPAVPAVAALANGQGNHAGIVKQLLNQAGATAGNVQGIGNVLKDVKGLNISITNVQLQNGGLVVSGMIGNNPFTTTATLELPTAAAAGTMAAQVVNPDAVTPILNLHLNAIHLSLLGLNVDTSNICVAINAQSGPGNLLGNLLTDVANLLNSGTPLSTILSGLSTTQLSTLLNGVTGLLNGVLGSLLGGGLTGGTLGGLTAAATPTTTSILHLSLGPVNLNLLGLDVNVDNCANGPVTVDVTATSGPGNLLGNLLTGVSNLLNGSNNPLATQVLNQLVGDVLALL